jgi:dephospho-CoA kinase
MLIALTGGIGSGKSTVAEIWHSMGATIVDADQLAREVVAAGSATLEKLSARFGDEVLNSDGSLNRQWLAERIFDNPSLRREVEAVMHPAIQVLAKSRIAAAPSPVIYVVPLLVETDSKLKFDSVVTLAVPEEVRIQRLAAQRGMSRSDSLQRIRAQATDEERNARADLVIDANCSFEQLRTRAEAAFRQLVGTRS